MSGSFTGRNADRDRILFLIGCNTGFRVSELCSMTIGDAVDEFGNVMDDLRVSASRMKGRARSRTVPLNSTAKKLLIYWREQLEKEGFFHRDNPLFPGVKGKPVGRCAVWRAITRAKRKAMIPGRIATHSMRKTFASNTYSQLLAMVAAGEPVDALREAADILGHVDPKATLHYLPSGDMSRRRAIIEKAAVGFDVQQMYQTLKT
jgi:integrase